MATHYVDSAYREPSPPPGGYRYATPRDALTGEPIRPDTIHKRVSDDRVDSRPTRTAHRDGWRAETTLRPLRLHTPEVETAPDAGDTTRGALGGHVYSGPFQKYLASGERNDRAEERADVRVWWRSAYGRGRVRAGLVARYGEKVGHRAYLAALCHATGDKDAETIAAELGRTVRWVARMAKIAGELARATHATAQTSAQTSA